jgi:hypothetical protein
LKVTVIFCGAGLAQRVNMDYVVLLNDPCSKSEQEKWTTVARAQAYFYKQFEFYSMGRPWESGKDSGIYVLQKPK